MIALLFGLLEANVHPSAISFVIVDPHDNYANYRALWVQRPGIPFMVPHVRVIRSTEDQRKVDEFLESCSFQREQPDTSNQDMYYRYLEHEAPPTHAKGLKEYLNWFRCF